jgi:ribosome-binding factor A
VFVSVFGDAEAKAATMDGLRSALGYIRRELGSRLQMRHTPDITFRLDESIERGARVNELLGEVAKESHVDASAHDRGDPEEQP